MLTQWCHKQKNIYIHILASLIYSTMQAISFYESPPSEPAQTAHDARRDSTQSPIKCMGGGAETKHPWVVGRPVGRSVGWRWTVSVDLVISGRRLRTNARDVNANVHHERSGQTSREAATAATAAVHCSDDPQNTTAARRPRLTIARYWFPGCRCVITIIVNRHHRLRHRHHHHPVICTRHVTRHAW